MMTLNAGGEMFWFPLTGTTYIGHTFLNLFLLLLLISPREQAVKFSLSHHKQRVDIASFTQGKTKMSRIGFGSGRREVQKRKRDEETLHSRVGTTLLSTIDGSVSTESVLKEITKAKRNIAATFGTNRVRLLPTGDLLVLGSDALSFHIGYVTDNHKTVDIPLEDCKFTDLGRECSVEVTGTGYARDLIACADNGELLLSTTVTDGTGDSFYQSMPLYTDDEAISCVQHGGMILLSNHHITTLA